MVRVVFPLGVALILGRVLKRPPPVVWAIGPPALLIARLSLRPFEHYWLLVIQAVAVWSTTATWRGLPIARMTTILALATIPMLIQTVVAHQLTRVDFRGYEQIVPMVEAELGTMGMFIAFDNRPWLPYLVPGRNALRSPLLGYLTTPSSRLELALDDLERDLASGGVAVIVEDGGLSVDVSLVRDEARPVRDAIDRHLELFTCTTMYMGGPTVWSRRQPCPPESVSP